MANPPLYPTGKDSTSGETATVHEFKPWREVGWIFRDGETVAIERRGNESRIASPLS